MNHMRRMREQNTMWDKEMSERAMNGLYDLYLYLLRKEKKGK